MAVQTNSFSIAHYILLIGMIVVCGWVVAYAVVHDTGGAVIDIPAASDSAPAVDNNSSVSECRQTVTNAVAQMWAYNPDVVPVKYKDIAMAYYTGPVNPAFRGECNGVTFACPAGTPRMDCDPCAAGNAREYAMGIHTRDMLAKHCGE